MTGKDIYVDNFKKSIRINLSLRASAIGTKIGCSPFKPTEKSRNGCCWANQIHKSNKLKSKNMEDLSNLFNMVNFNSHMLVCVIINTHFG